MAVDIQGTVIAMLRANADVASEVGMVTGGDNTRIVAVVGEMDDHYAAQMPRPLVLVTETGGLSIDTISPLGYPRLDVRCFGKEPGGVYESSKLGRIVHEALQGYSALGDGIAAITLSGGPTGGREPDTEWAYNLRVYDVLGEG